MTDQEAIPVLEAGPPDPLTHEYKVWLMANQRGINALRRSTLGGGEIQGEWINFYYRDRDIPGIRCSVCYKDIPYWTRDNPAPKFCPNCGVQML